MTSWTENMRSEHSFKNNFILRRPGVAYFADIIKITKTQEK